MFAGAAGAAHTVPEHLVEPVLDDETGRAHVDPVRHLAADRAVHIRAVRHEAQRVGPEAEGRAEEETVCVRGGAPDFHHQVVDSAAVVYGSAAVGNHGRPGARAR